MPPPPLRIPSPIASIVESGSVSPGGTAAMPLPSENAHAGSHNAASASLPPEGLPLPPEAVRDGGEDDIEEGLAASPPPPFSSFSRWQKRGIVLGAAISALFSPLSAQIYFPALNLLARDLGVSESQITLSVTTYMIFQGVMPMFVGGFADSTGRRPAYAACFIIYIAANIGLALTTSYGGLLAVRCLQSAGASSTMALCQAVVADVVTSAERGSYIGFTVLPVVLAPSLGPVIGGLLAQYLGWRAIFWFLAIFAAAAFILMALFFPETCRSIVGDGSELPHPAYRTVYQLCADIRRRRARRARQRLRAQHRAERLRKAAATPRFPPPAETSGVFNDDNAWLARTASAASATSTLSQHGEYAPLAVSFPNPVGTLKLLGRPNVFILCAYSSVVFAGFYAVATALPSQLARLHGLDDLHIGLMYLPMAAGSIVAAAVMGPLLDWNFRRHSALLGLEVDRSRQIDLAGFPIEKARLEVGAPLLSISIAAMLSWGWALERSPGLAAPVVLLFLFGVGMIGFNNASNVLLVDLCPGRAGAAVAGNNLTRCLVGAGASAAIIPLINVLGGGWAFVLLGGLYVVFLPALWVLMKKGMGWREQEERKVAEERSAAATPEVPETKDEGVRG